MEQNFGNISTCKNDTIKLSVIVPIYKTEQYLQQCIDSILTQSFDDFELILVDDGSPDQCPQICDRYAKIDNRIKVIHKENGGLVSARKIGLSEARGEYVAYVDSDDWIESELFSKVFQKRNIDGFDMIATGYSRCYEDHISLVRNEIKSGVYENKKLNELWEKAIYSGKYYTPGIIPSACTKVFKRELLKKVQFDIDNRITNGEDVALTYQCIMLSQRIVVDNSISGYMCRVNHNSMTFTYGSEYYSRLCYLYDYLEVALSKWDEFGLVKQAHFLFANMLETFIEYSFKSYCWQFRKQYLFLNSMFNQYDCSHVNVLDIVDLLPKYSRSMLNRLHKNQMLLLLLQWYLSKIFRRAKMIFTR